MYHLQQQGSWMQMMTGMTMRMLLMEAAMAMVKISALVKKMVFHAPFQSSLRCNAHIRS